MLAVTSFPVSAEQPDPAQCLGGKLDAPIRIEIFSDFQCPACRSLYLETMKQVLRDYCAYDKVCVIYHEFPLTIHKYARDAARYSIAAQKLGRRQWQAVMDSLYNLQPSWSIDGNVEAAVAKAVSAEDLQKIKALAFEPSINETIVREIATGQRREIRSTPTLFVSAIGREQKVEGPVPYQVLKEYFDSIIK
jgi:protein-disulfide isomerase